MLASDSLKLVLEDKLFKDQGQVFALAAVGAGATAIGFAWLVHRSLPVPLAAAIAGIAGGFAMPYLFKDIKYQ